MCKSSSCYTRLVYFLLLFGCKTLFYLFCFQRKGKNAGKLHCCNQSDSKSSILVMIIFVGRRCLTPRVCHFNFYQLLERLCEKLRGEILLMLTSHHCEYDLKVSSLIRRLSGGCQEVFVLLVLFCSFLWIEGILHSISCWQRHFICRERQRGRRGGRQGDRSW